MCIVGFVGTLWCVFLNAKQFHKLYIHEVENWLLSEATVCGYLLKSLH